MKGLRFEFTGLALMGWAWSSRPRQLADFANCFPVAIGHRNTEQFLGACREPGSTHPFWRMEIEHLIAQMKPLTRLLQAVEFLQVGVLGRGSQKTQMQTAGISLGLGKWIFRDCRIDCFETDKEDMGFKTVTHSDFSGQLFGELRSVLFGTVEDCVAALDIRPDFFRTHVFEQDNQLLHRQRVVPAHINASEKRYVYIHTIIV